VPLVATFPALDQVHPAARDAHATAGLSLGERVALGLHREPCLRSCRKNSQERAVRNLSMHLLAAPVSNRPRRLPANRGLRDQPMRIMPTVPVVAASAHRQNARAGRWPMLDESPAIAEINPVWTMPAAVLVLAWFSAIAADVVRTGQRYQAARRGGSWP